MNRLLIGCIYELTNFVLEWIDTLINFMVMKFKQAVTNIQKINGRLALGIELLEQHTKVLLLELHKVRF